MDSDETLLMLEVASYARRKRFGPDLPPKANRIDFYNMSLRINRITYVPGIL
jgi:hypothetical protein